ncbi:MAG: hypothetical protein NC247_08015 [Ruminococcus flavefaciens]|nr:hypothetical protein [Ruminococcus flavefaciens]MCM1360360.1 hypothetical protein [Clostridiales bacterium]MCM1434740.1 hypothetical protein [Ruminococcus flavefaciens]
MNHRLITLAAVVLTALGAFCGCGKEESKVEEILTESEKAFNEKYKDIPDDEEGPILSISNTTAPAGGRAEVTVSVKNAADKWNVCGIHVSYPEELDCVNAHEEGNEAEYELGEAAEDASFSSAMEWQGERPEEMEKKKLGAFFFTAGFTKQGGGDGDIVTFYLDIPENAESGTVYPIDFYFFDADIFNDLSENRSMEKYAFSHWESGSVTVE